jgi:Predicted membrane protein
MERLRHYVLVRHGQNWIQLFRFALVGGSGVVVNLFVAIMCKKIGPDENGIFFDLPLTDFNVRWYHVYSTIAFLVANLWNFQLNRLWTFRSAKHAGWFKEYFPFLTVGVPRPDCRSRHPHAADAPEFDLLAVDDVLR